MLIDFLMALQFVFDKHQLNERARIIGLIEARMNFHQQLINDNKSGLAAQALIAENEYLLTKIKQS